MSRRILVTGATGFIGKLVLARLLEDPRAEKIFVVMRPAGDVERAKRRLESLSRSPVFAGAPAGWMSRVEAVPGDLLEENLGLDPELRARLCDEITHVIHIAASVSFNLPGAKAAAINIDGALRVQALAEEAHAEKLVNVSTAYVHPPGRGPHHQALVDLPEDVETLLADTRKDAAAVQLRTGHANSYTLTKCLAEHMLTARVDKVPLTLVRPSIVSASWTWPSPGWLDSAAAYAGLIAAVGTGYYRSVPASKETRIDIVPVDVVAERIVDAIDEDADILHAVAGLHNSTRVDEQTTIVLRTLRNRPVMATPLVVRVDSGDQVHNVLHKTLHRVPLQLKERTAERKGDARGARSARRDLTRIEQLDRDFQAFSHHTWDFQGARMPDDFERGAYIRLVCQGVHRHLLRGDPRAVPVAGRKAPDSDLRWALRRSGASPLHRGFGLLLRRTARRCLEAATVNVDALEAAVAAVPDGHGIVLCPNHRSYADFLMISYVIHSLPELDLRLPDIAAASGFAKVPVLGSLFSRMGAFYLTRGQGAADAKLVEQVHEKVQAERVLQVFLEGRRSRSGAFLPPRRGLLRCLQATRKPFALIPLTLSFDRVPEEFALLNELHRKGKSPMRLGGLARWLAKVESGEVELGRLHLSADAPVMMGPDTDVNQAAAQVMAGMQSASATTMFHLRSFAARADVKASDLKSWLQDRGAHVLPSKLNEEVTDAVERWQRPHWQHHFGGVMARLAGDHPAISDHLSRTVFVPDVPDATDAFAERIAHVLAGSVADDWQRTISALADGRPATLADVLRREPTVWPDEARAALDFMVRRHVLVKKGDAYTPGADFDQLGSLAVACGWPPLDGESDDDRPRDRGDRLPGSPRAPRPGPAVA